ncbi:S-layer homology domain-containing protein [Paenibacillus oryzisoli]|uniref:S-layer homology domain-containing protein n=1 Tax=Paenibacillus oryzisoli TaxID=1850517 RepID=UPI003D2E39AB
MKRSLSVISSAVLAFSLLTSAAYAVESQSTPPVASTAAAVVKTTEDYQDLAQVDSELKAKIDALLALGIMEGKGDTFDLTGSMTRAEAAKVAAKIFKLTVDVQAPSSFKDVDAADEAIAWAIPYIEAAKAKGVIEGVAEDVFSPSEPVTLGQLAAILVRGFGKAADVQTTTPWYDGYLAVAKANGVDLGASGDATATRAELVAGAYAAQQVIENLSKPAKASVKEVKQLGVKTVSVVLDRDVDPAKAKLALTKGTTSLGTSVVWGDDKQSATLTLTDVKLGDADYAVTLGGLDAVDIDQAKGMFHGQAEKVTKLEFAGSGDTIAKSPKVRVEVKPTNQFGETATFSSANYTVYATTANAATVVKAEDGKLYVQLNTTDAALISNTSQISVNIYDNNDHVSATKNFIVGLQPLLTKVELGEAAYKNGKTALSSAGDMVVIPLKQYDQYGAIITKESDSVILPTVSVTPYEAKLKAEVVDDNNDGIDDIVVRADAKLETAGDYTVQVFGAGSTATATIATKATAIAKKVELVQPNDTWAAGDSNKYVELVAYDADGTKLSSDDVAQNAKDGRFTVSVTGNLVTGESGDVPAVMLDSKKLIVTDGPNKGKIYIKKLEGKGTANVFAAIIGVGVNSTAQLNVPITEVRYPAGLRIATNLAGKAVNTADNNGKLQIFDQYGDTFTGFATTQSGNRIDLIENGRSVTYDVYATVTPSADYVGTYSGDLVLAPGTQELTVGQFSDKEFKFTPGGAATNATLAARFQLRKRDFTGGLVGNVLDDSVSAKSMKFQVLDPAREKLKYSLNGARDLFSTMDNELTKNIPAATVPDSSILGISLSLSAKDEAANEVKIPNSIVTVVSDTYSTANLQISGGKVYVLGNKAGLANLTAVYLNAKGETNFIKTAITVKSDPIAVQSISSSTSKTFTRAAVDGALAWVVMGDVAVKDQYGDEFKNANLAIYKDVAPVLYMINDVTEGVHASLSMSAEGVNNQVNVTYDSGVTGGSITMTAVAANGMSATTRVILSN